MKILGAIFDADGTLLDSLSIWESIAEDYIKSKGVIPKENLRERFSEMSLIQGAEYFRAEYGLTLSVAEIISEIDAMLLRFYRDDVKLKPGVREFVERLNASGVRMCVATSTSRELINAALERNGINGFFSEVVTCTDVGMNKDKPDIFIYTAKRLGIAPEETAVFEDSPHAAESAKKAGCITVGVYDKYQANVQNRLRAASDIYISSFNETEGIEL